MPNLPDSSLANAASERKERLLALKKRKAGELTDDNGLGRSSKIALKQRNFDPLTRQPIQRSAHGPIRVDALDAVPNSDTDTVERRMMGVAESIVKEDETKRMQELDLLNIQPKRVNWDLKRDMDKRMRKMDKRTQEAYEYLFRRRLLAMRKGTATAQQLPGGADILANMSAADTNRKRSNQDDGDQSEDEDIQ